MFCGVLGRPSPDCPTGRIWCRTRSGTRPPGITTRKDSPRCCCRLPRRTSSASGTRTASHQVPLREVNTGTCWNSLDGVIVLLVSDAAEELERRIDRLRVAVRQAVLAGDRE